MTDQIERCLCGGECVIVARWRITCLYCAYMSIRRADKNVVVGLHNRMMVAARAPASQDIETMDLTELQRFAIERAGRVEAAELQANLAHQALLDERRQWETERATLTAQSDAYWRQIQQAADHLDELIAAHKRQIADLTDALAPVEWEPGRVPTEPGWYAYQERRPGTDGYFAVDVIHVIDGDDGLVAEYPGGGEGTINQMARWHGPIVLPRKRVGE